MISPANRVKHLFVDTDLNIVAGICICVDIFAALFFGADLADGNRQLIAAFNLIDPAISDPDHMVRNIQHLKIVGGGDHGDVSFFAEPL